MEYNECGNTKYHAYLKDERTLVAFTTVEKNLYEWICKYFADYYTIDYGLTDRCIDFSVEYIDDERLFYNAMKRFGKLNTQFSIHGYIDAEYVKFEDCFIATDKSHIIYRGDKEVCVYAPRYSFEVGLIAMRIIRDVFSKRHENIGEFVIHSGTVSINGNGLTFIGPKNAGKTTAVLAMLKCLKASFVSNDKTYIGIQPNGIVKAYGWPTTCSIAMGSLNSFPQIVNYVSANILEYPQYVPDYKKPKLELTSNEINKIFNVPISSSCASKIIFFPLISRSIQKTVIEMCSPEKAKDIICDNLLTPNDPHYPDFLGFRDSNDDYYYKEAYRIASTIAEKVPCFELHYGHDANELASSLRSFLSSHGIIV